MPENSDDNPSPRTRKTSTANLASRAARELVEPLNEKLGTFQAEAVKFEAIAERIRASGRAEPGTAEAARTLQALVLEEGRMLAQSLESQPDAIRGHSRVTDTMRVLRMIEERLGNAIETMKPRPPRR